MIRILLAVIIIIASSHGAAAQRYRPVANPVFYVNQSLGQDSGDCTSPGAGACKTFLGAFNLACSSIDSDGHYITLQGDPGQIFTDPLNIIQGNTTSGSGEGQMQPDCVGSNQIVMDLGGSTLSTVGTAIFVRGLPIWLTVQNGTITSPTAGNDIECYGGGVTVELAGSITFGPTSQEYAQLSATRRCRVVTRLGASLTFTGGGQSAIEAIIGGGAEIEAPIRFVGNPSYPLAVYQAVHDSYITFYGASQSGSVVGRQWTVSKGGIIDTFGQTGTYPLPNSYLPGNSSGFYGLGGGSMDTPGSPSPASCGTPVQVGGTDRSGSVTLGGGAATSCSISFTTLTTFRCVASSNKLQNPASVNVLPPVGSVSGKMTFSYSSNTGQTISWKCDGAQI